MRRTYVPHRHQVGVERCQRRPYRCAGAFLSALKIMTDPLLLGFGKPQLRQEAREWLMRAVIAEALGQEFVRSRDPWGKYERVMLEAQDRA
jgi:hypothetical protein